MTGIALPIQTEVNAKLRSYVVSSFLASFMSFLIATAALFAAEIYRAYILLFKALGSVQTVVLPILGQIIMSLLIDNYGWFDLPLALIQILGAVILIVGVMMVVIPSKKGQSAINGKLGGVLESSIIAATVSFVVGTIILLIYVGAVERSFGKVSLALGSRRPWWIWLGGIFGAFMVFGNAYLVPLIGTGALIIFALLGQMGTSLMVDKYGLLGAVRKEILRVQYLGILVMLAGVILIKI